MAFLNPERVERQGGQNQLYERSTEKGFSKEKLEEETEGKIPHGFSETWAMFAGPSGQARIQPKRPQYPYPYTLELERGGLRRPPRKNNALRKKLPEGYIAKENRPKGALLRKSCLESSLSPKGYIAKAMEKPKTMTKQV